MKNLLPLLVIGGLLVAGCASPPPPDMTWVPQARTVAQLVPPKLLSLLQQEIARGGLDVAIGVCRVQAPEMARAASEQSGWNIRRVSLRNRNPKAVPDTWERSALEDFDRRAAAGEGAARLEHAEVVQEGGQRVMRYIRALPTMDLCTGCHGPTERLSTAVQERLKALYPDDRATGYGVGQIRGAITLRRPAS